MRRLALASAARQCSFYHILKCWPFILRLEDGNNCNGSYIGMSEDVQQDTDHLNDTQRKSLVRMSSMAWWDQVRHDLSVNIPRQTIQGYLDSISSLSIKTIKSKVILAVYSYRYLQSKLMFNLSHASMVKIQYSSKWVNPLY